MVPLAFKLLWLFHASLGLDRASSTSSTVPGGEKPKSTGCEADLPTFRFDMINQRMALKIFLAPRCYREFGLLSAFIISNCFGCSVVFYALV